jgi:hypothetical protein
VSNKSFFGPHCLWWTHGGLEFLQVEEPQEFAASLVFSVVMVQYGPVLNVPDKGWDRLYQS